MKRIKHQKDLLPLEREKTLCCCGVCVGSKFFFFLSPIYTKVDEGHAHDDDIYVRLRRSCAKCFDKERSTYIYLDDDKTLSSMPHWTSVRLQVPPNSR